MPMKYDKFVVPAFILTGIWIGMAGTSWLSNTLIDRAKLEPIIVTVTKKPEPPIPYYLCKHRYPLISQHGDFMRCYRGKKL